MERYFLIGYFMRTDTAGRIDSYIKRCEDFPSKKSIIEDIHLMPAVVECRIMSVSELTAEEHEKFTAK